MNDTKARLLQAACEAAGDAHRLAGRLGISEAMLRKYLGAQFPVPDPVFLTAVDFLLGKRGPEH